VGGGFGHHRDHGDSRSARTDHDHLLGGIVRVLRPELRMQNRSGKVRDARDLRVIRFVVIVVACAEIEEARGAAPNAGRRGFPW